MKKDVILQHKEDRKKECSFEYNNRMILNDQKGRNNVVNK